LRCTGQVPNKAVRSLKTKDWAQKVLEKAAKLLKTPEAPRPEVLRARSLQLCACLERSRTCRRCLGAKVSAVFAFGIRGWFRHKPQTQRRRLRYWLGSGVGSVRFFFSPDTRDESRNVSGNKEVVNISSSRQGMWRLPVARLWALTDEGDRPIDTRRSESRAALFSTRRRLRPRVPSSMFMLV